MKVSGAVEKTLGFFENDFDEQLFNAIIDRRYVEALKMLRHRRQIRSGKI